MEIDVWLSRENNHRGMRSELLIVSHQKLVATHDRHGKIQQNQTAVGPHTPVIVFTAEPNIDFHNLPTFVVDVLPKPFHIKQLLKLVSKYAVPVFE